MLLLRYFRINIRDLGESEFKYTLGIAQLLVLIEGVRVLAIELEWKANSKVTLF